MSLSREQAQQLLNNNELDGWSVMADMIISGPTTIRVVLVIRDNPNNRVTWMVIQKDDADLSFSTKPASYAEENAIRLLQRFVNLPEPPEN